MLTRLRTWAFIAAMVIMLGPMQWNRWWGFWVSVFGVLIVTHRIALVAQDWHTTDRPLDIFISAGMISNLIAVAANGGRMPALRFTAVPYRWWQPVTDATRLYPLCDIIFGAISIGDCIIAVGALALLWKWIVDWYSRVEDETQATSL